MATYIKEVRIPAAELEMLDAIMDYVTPMTGAEAMRIENACTVSWAWQKADEDCGWFDRNITAEFDNGMIMDAMFSIEFGERNGYFAGVQFGNKDTLFVAVGESNENCRPTFGYDDHVNRCIIGDYAVAYCNDLYIMRIVPDGDFDCKLLDGNLYDASEVSA